MRRRVVLILILVVAGVAGWRVIRFTSERRNRLFQSAKELSGAASNSAAYSWDAAVEKAKAERGAELGGALDRVAVELVTVRAVLDHGCGRGALVATSRGRLG